MNKQQKDFIDTVAAETRLYSAQDVAQMLLHVVALSVPAPKATRSYAKDLAKAVGVCERMITLGKYTEAQIKAALRLRAFYKRIEATDPSIFEEVIETARENLIK